METYATRPRAARNHGQAAVERGLGRVAGAPNSALNAMAGEEMLRGLPSRERAVPQDLTQALLERFSVPLTGLRVYEDRGLDGIGQAAYAQGNEIHFAEGYYDPLTQRGRDMFFHEAAHVIQQGAGMVPGHGIVENSVLESQANFGFAAPESFSMPATSVGAPIQGWWPWSSWKTTGVNDRGYEDLDANASVNKAKRSAANFSLVSSIGALASAIPNIYGQFIGNTNNNNIGNIIGSILKALGGGLNAFGSYGGMAANFFNLKYGSEDEKTENLLFGIGNTSSLASGVLTSILPFINEGTANVIGKAVSGLGIATGSAKAFGSIFKIINGCRSGDMEKIIDGGLDGLLAVANVTGNILKLLQPTPFVGSMFTGSSAAVNIIKILTKKMLPQPKQGLAQPVSAA